MEQVEMNNMYINIYVHNGSEMGSYVYSIGPCIIVIVEE